MAKEKIVNLNQGKLKEIKIKKEKYFVELAKIPFLFYFTAKTCKFESLFRQLSPNHMISCIMS